MKSPGTSQLDRMRSKNTVTPLQSHDCYHGTKPLQSSHPEEWQWQWLERQGKEFRFYATEVQSLESTHFLLIWSNTADRRKKHCLCLLICVSTNLANWCIQVFWSMKNHQTLQLETSRQKLEHLFYSLKSMLQICCHLPLITCPPSTPPTFLFGKRHWHISERSCKDSGNLTVWGCLSLSLYSCHSHFWK